MASSPDNDTGASCPVYAAFFPSGIEDVVHAALSRLALQYHLSIETCPYDDPAVSNCCSPPPSVNAEDSAQSCTTKPEGLLLFRIHRLASTGETNASRCALADANLYGFLAAACTLRVLERLCLHLWTQPIVHCSNAEVINAINSAVEQKAVTTQQSVLATLSSLRSFWGKLQRERSPLMPRSAAMWGPQFFSPITNADVAFRVNCERRVMDDQPGTLKSVELAAAAGDALWERHNGHAWEVSMLYHNVDFFLLQDNDRWLTCALTLSPPAPPRCGYDVDLTFQYAAELLRQHICGALRRGEVSLSQVKGLVPRVSSERQEIRWSKGACAMRSTLASALCTYANLDNAAAAVSGSPACPVLMLDPFCGSGTTLLEGWVQLLAQSGPSDGENHAAATCRVGGVLMGSELEMADVRRTYANTRADYLGRIAALYGYHLGGVITRESKRWTALQEAIVVWQGQIEDRVRAVVRSGAYLTCGPEGLRELLCSSIPPLVDPHASESSSSGSAAAGVPQGGAAFSVVRCDATRVPLRTASVECIVSDMPFGRRCGSHKVNVRLYPPFMRECHRLLRAPSTLAGASDKTEMDTPCTRETSEWWRRSGSAKQGNRGGRAVLLTVEYRLMLQTLEELKEECPFHLVTPPFQVDMNGLFPFVFVLDKL